MPALVFPLAWNNHVRDPPLTRMHECEAMITPHIGYIEEYGAIYFDANWKPPKLSLPTIGYIYIGRDVPDAPSNLRGKISYRVKIERILTRNELLNDSNEQKYVPFWRYQCLHGVWPRTSPFAGQKHEPSEYWLKITEIKRLPNGVPPKNVINNHTIRFGVRVDENKIKRALNCSVEKLMSVEYEFLK